MPGNMFRLILKWKLHVAWFLSLLAGHLVSSDCSFPFKIPVGTESFSLPWVGSVLLRQGCSMWNKVLCCCCMEAHWFGALSATVRRAADSARLRLRLYSAQQWTGGQGGELTREFYEEWNQFSSPRRSQTVHVHSAVPRARATHIPMMPETAHTKMWWGE